MSKPNQSAVKLLPSVPRPSTWMFKTANGADLNISIPGTQFGIVLSGGQLFVQNNNSPPLETLNFAGLGGGAGIQPIPVPGNFDFATTAFFCKGLVYTGPLAGSQLTINDFRGPCLFFQGSAQAGPTYSAMLMFMGASWATAIPGVPDTLRPAAMAATCRGIVAFHGMAASLIPGSIGGFMAYGICL